MSGEHRPGADTGFERIVHELRRLPERPEGAVEEIMAALEPRADRAPRPSPWSSFWSWLRRPGLTVSPLTAGAAVAAVLVVLSARAPREVPVPGDDLSGPVLHQFVFVAEDARAVAVVGDFNDWDPTRSQLERRGADGVWVAELELEAGRHLYSFVVNGSEWAPDETAPRAPDDDFGRPSSVLLIPASRGI